MEPSRLPPGVRAEVFTHADGRQVTVYKAPFSTEEPRVRVEEGQQVLYCMYAHYVFRWPRGAVRLDVGHGTVERHTLLRGDVAIAGPWAAETLMAFAVAWVRAELFRVRET